MNKLVLILCVAMFGALLDWLFGLKTDDRPRRDWPHLHRSAQIDEAAVVPLLTSTRGIGEITVTEIKNGRAPATWLDGTYKQ